MTCLKKFIIYIIKQSKLINNIEYLDKIDLNTNNKNSVFYCMLQYIKLITGNQNKKDLIKNDFKILSEFFCLQKNFLNKKKIRIIKKTNRIVDITLPGRGINLGSLHPITKTINNIADIFIKLGFIQIYGPEIEDQYNNFDFLNISENHPARKNQDTFYIKNIGLLRTHTSSVQLKAMKKNIPPFKFLSIGKVFRNDNDVTHSPVFHQAEGIIVNNNINFANLKNIIIDFLYSFFKKKMKIRFRSSYFPFTEPSVEVDIKCVNCKTKCNICNNTKWVEILGCGMIHPDILKNCNIDNKKYRGIAFGIGVDRLSMLKYEIQDIRLNFENDINFLKQF